MFLNVVVITIYRNEVRELPVYNKDIDLDNIIIPNKVA